MHLFDGALEFYPSQGAGDSGLAFVDIPQAGRAAADAPDRLGFNMRYEQVSEGGECSGWRV